MIYTPSQSEIYRISYLFVQSTGVYMYIAEGIDD